MLSATTSTLFIATTKVAAVGRHHRRGAAALRPRHLFCELVVDLVDGDLDVGLVDVDLDVDLVGVDLDVDSPSSLNPKVITRAPEVRLTC